MDTDEKVRAFCDAWQSLSVIYEDYARRSGISYNGLCILDAIQQTENCTQKFICEKTLMPKQTVNNVITAFYKSGYIELLELLENRRIKTIHLTPEGERYVNALIPHIYEADWRAMEVLTAEQQDTLIQLMDTFVAAFRREMLGE